MAELEHPVRNGSPGLETIEPKGIWAYLQARTDEADVFGRAMTAKAGAEVAAVLDAYDFTGLGTIADVGGGRGHLLQAILDSAPESRRPFRPARGDRQLGRRTWATGHNGR